MIVEGHLAPGEPLNRLFPVLARRHGFVEGDLRGYRVLRKALDARGRGSPRVFYRLELHLAPGEGPPRELRPDCVPIGARRPAAPRTTRRPVIVGSGPAGTFAALRLLEAGVTPLLLEQGRPVDERARDVRLLRAKGRLDPWSNVAFGEGGAGTFSDGKLRTRRNDEGIRDVLATFVHHGARPALLYESHPHMGTDVLVRVTRSLGAWLLEHDVDLRFGARVVDLLVHARRVRGVRLADGSEVPSDGVILAPGNSARGLYRALVEAGVGVEARASALGFRVEHPREWVDLRQMGLAAVTAGQWGAEYNLAAQIGDRGVYSFCMCPGGYVVPSQVEEGTVRVNGMSNSARRAPYSNSALVVTVSPNDYVLPGEAAARGEALDGVAFQAACERRAGELGGGRGAAPAQLVVDFLAGREPADVPATSFRPAVTPAPLHRFYSPALTGALAEALRRFDRRMPGFAGSDAVLIGPETGTSAPLTIERGPDGQSPSHPGLFPAGEGTGHAGGIMSSALDGLRAAEAWLGANGISSAYGS